MSIFKWQQTVWGRKKNWKERNEQAVTEFPKFCYFYPGYRYLSGNLRPHSLMDKIQDSGSCDLGSIPCEVTNAIINS